MLGKAKKRQWRHKTSTHGQEPPQLQQGSVVLVDQMVSPTPDLIAQIAGFLTKKPYQYATVFVDQATRFSFVYLQKTATADKTLDVKKAFKACAAHQGIQVQAYHADNDIFKANAWVKQCITDRQRLTFAGVNAHHQNGLAERYIGEFAEPGTNDDDPRQLTMTMKRNNSSLAVHHTHGKQHSQRNTISHGRLSLVELVGSLIIESTVCSAITLLVIAIVAGLGSKA